MSLWHVMISKYVNHTEKQNQPISSQHFLSLNGNTGLPFA